jgi:hypothetical protein
MRYFVKDELIFYHTAQANVETFSKLLDEMGRSDLAVRHIVDEEALARAMAEGFSDELEKEVGARMLAALGDSRALLCTCSSIGSCAEVAAKGSVRPVLRIDRPMAEKAVDCGTLVVVAAALQSTLAPTRALLDKVASERGVSLEVHEFLCAGAWGKFVAGDGEGYARAIAERLPEAALLGDSIVLAQASMAGATLYCGELAVPVFSSPRLGLEAALYQYDK